MLVILLFSSEFSIEAATFRWLSFRTVLIQPLYTLLHVETSPLDAVLNVIPRPHFKECMNFKKYSSNFPINEKKKQENQQNNTKENFSMWYSYLLSLS